MDPLNVTKQLGVNYTLPKGQSDFWGFSREDGEFMVFFSCRVSIESARIDSCSHSLRVSEVGWMKRKLLNSFGGVGDLSGRSGGGYRSRFLHVKCVPTKEIERNPYTSLLCFAFSNNLNNKFR